MGLNETPSGERVHIALFGKRNAGKSSLINSLTGQKLAIVSEIKGTTTDPVYKAMELLPLGPVVMIDTPGLDDDSSLGAERVEKAIGVLNKTDIAVLVATEDGFSEFELELLNKIKSRNIPFVVVVNKSDLLTGKTEVQTISNEITKLTGFPCEFVSAKSGYGIDKLKEHLASLIPDDKHDVKLISDLVSVGDVVVLVVPIDSSAPKGRLILPQQQVIRDLLDSNAICAITQVSELGDTLLKLSKPPALVVTDSQAFAEVSKIIPTSVLLTSFSILFARYKGELDLLTTGAETISKLNDGDKILVAEGCTHHRQCEDIGTVKIPRLLQKVTGKTFVFDTCSGGTFPDDLENYKLVIHCGGCTLNRREMQHRLMTVSARNVPIVNYGVLLAKLNGILDRSLEVFKL